MGEQSPKRPGAVKSILLVAIGVASLLLAVFPPMMWIVQTVLGSPGPGAWGWLLLSVWFLAFAFPAWLAFKTASPGRPPNSDDDALDAIPCPACGELDIVRGPDARGWVRSRCRTARCLTCGSRWSVPADLWKRLPFANPGDPYETEADLALLASHSALTFGGVLLVLGWIAAVIAGTVLICPWIKRFSPRSEPFAFVGTVLAWASGYLLRRFLLPKRSPGRRCVKCGYDLSRCTTDRCPECGTAVGQGQTSATNGN